MALDPEMQEPTEDGTPSEARPDASGTAPDDASIALLQQIAGQLTALTSHVTEMKSELADVRAENAALATKTEPSKTKRLAYLGGQPPARPKPPEPEQPSEEASDQAQEPQSDVPMSDEDVQKLLAEEEENATEVQPEPTAAESEQPAAPEPAATQPEEPQEEPEPDSDEDVTDAEVHQLLAGVAETAKLAAQEDEEEHSPISTDELQDLVSETQEAATPPIKPLSKEDAEHAEDETVEVGVTAIQAGKDVGDEKSDEAADEALEEPVKPRREVVVPTFEVDPDAVKRVPAHLAIAALAIPVRVDESELVLRVVEPIDRIAFDIIGDATTMKVRPEPAPMEEVLAALRSAYGSDSHPEERQAVAAVAPRKITKGVEKRSKRARKRVKRR